MFTRDIRVNYGVIEDICNKLEKYKEALSTMKEVVSRINKKLENENEGKAVEALNELVKSINKDIKSCSKEVEDLYKLFNGYFNDMQNIIRPNNIDIMMRVDRNDIYWNMQSIFSACDAVGNIKLNTDNYMNYGYSSYGETEEEKKNKKDNYRKIKEIWGIIDKYKGRLNDQKEEMQSLYDSKIIPYENMDDDYAKKASNLYNDYTSFGEVLYDSITSACSSIFDLLGGFVTAIADVLVGLVQVLFGVVKFIVIELGALVGVAVLGVTGDVPDWLQYCLDKSCEYYDTATTILEDPFIIVEGMSQEISDTIEENSISYSCGYAVGVVADIVYGDKLLSKVKLKGTDVIDIGKVDDVVDGSVSSVDEVIDVVDDIEGVGNLKFKEGYYVRHTTGAVEKFTERNGISGGHNYDEFKNYFKDKSNKYELVEINRIQHSDIDGIFDIEYKVKFEKTDYTGTKGTGEYKTLPNGDKVYKKTVYDPKIISNDQIIDLSKKAMEEGIKNERVINLVKQNKMKIKGQANYNGKIFKFEGIKNLETGEIENAYPVLEWEK